MAPVRLLVLVLAALAPACARSDARWIEDLGHPDPFVRALAAFAVCEQAPQHARLALPALLETVDRSELELQGLAAAQLARVAPALPGELVQALLDDPFATVERREALHAALAAAGERAVQPLLDALQAAPRDREAELQGLLARIQRGLRAPPGSGR